MDTKTDSAEAERIAAFRRRMAQPIEIVIEDAVAYWLEDGNGRKLGTESSRTVEPLAATLRAIEDGVRPEDLVVWARLTDGTRYEVGSGALLVGMARRSAHIPR
jgi:hypothetical protein